MMDKLSSLEMEYLEEDLTVSSLIKRGRLAKYKAWSELDELERREYINSLDEDIKEENKKGRFKKDKKLIELKQNLIFYKEEDKRHLYPLKNARIDIAGSLKEIYGMQRLIDRYDANSFVGDAFNEEFADLDPEEKTDKKALSAATDNLCVKLKKLEHQIYDKDARYEDIRESYEMNK